MESRIGYHERLQQLFKPYNAELTRLIRSVGLGNLRQDPDWQQAKAEYVQLHPNLAYFWILPGLKFENFSLCLCEVFRYDEGAAEIQEQLAHEGEYTAAKKSLEEITPILQASELEEVKIAKEIADFFLPYLKTTAIPHKIVKRAGMVPYQFERFKRIKK